MIWSMDSFDPNEVVSQATQEREDQRSHAKAVLEWLLADRRQGEMYRRSDLIEEIAAETGLSPEEVASGIRGTVGDVVDPVQQVTARNEKHVGVIEYHTYPDDGAYGYVQYHDRLGKRKRVVCAKCVEEADLEENVSHATEGEGTVPADCGWEALLERVRGHYNADHDAVPDTIEPGASLLSNTTIGGNTAFHAGNDGTGSGLDADTLDGDDSSDIGGGNIINRGFSGTAIVSQSATFTRSSVDIAGSSDRADGGGGGNALAKTTISGVSHSQVRQQLTWVADPDNKTNIRFEATGKLNGNTFFNTIVFPSTFRTATQTTTSQTITPNDTLYLRAFVSGLGEGGSAEARIDNADVTRSGPIPYSGPASLLTGEEGQKEVGTPNSKQSAATVNLGNVTTGQSYYVKRSFITQPTTIEPRLRFLSTYQL